VSAPDQSYGLLPDGQADQRRLLPAPTPKASNETGLPSDSFTLGDVRLTPEGWVSFAWPTRPGQLYRVEFKAGLSDPAWQPLAELPATGEALRFIDTTPASAGQGFYRVRLEP
jgi:hypothetical protein